MKLPRDDGTWGRKIGGLYLKAFLYFTPLGWICLIAWAILSLIAMVVSPLVRRVQSMALDALPVQKSPMPVSAMQKFALPAATVLLVVAVVTGVGVYLMGWDWHPEDAGARLRRECESIIREAYRDAYASHYISDQGIERAVGGCIEKRGLAGR
jgi:hypothetical protein